MSHDLVVHGGLTVSGDGVRRADVAITDGVIAEVAPEIGPGAARESFDASGRYVLPGVIDAHNHPYYADDIEAFSLAAAAGGVTTLVPFAGRRMQDHDPGQALVDTVADFVAAGQKSSYLDFGAHAIVSPHDDPAVFVPELISRGVSSFKAFTAFPGARMLSDDQILALMETAAGAGALCMVHCENGHAITHLERQLTGAGQADGCRLRPVAPGTAGVGGGVPGPGARRDRRVRLLHSPRQRGGVAGRAAPVPQSARAAAIRGDLPALPAARRRRPAADGRPGQDIAADTRRGRPGGAMGCAAGRRDRRNRQRRLRPDAGGEADPTATSLTSRSASRVSSRCCRSSRTRPCIPTGSACQALVRVFCENPADIFGLGHRKGRLLPGLDGNLVVFDPLRPWTVDAREQHGNSDYSIYDGRAVLGRPVLTVQRGRTVLRDGSVVASRGSGVFLPAVTRGGTS